MRCSSWHLIDEGIKMKSFSLKALALCLITAVLAIGISMASGVVRDRMHYRAQALTSIGQSHAGAQTLVPPTLVLPIEERYIEETKVEENSKQKVQKIERVVQRRVVVLPETVHIQAQVDVQPKKRGLFAANTYLSKAQVRGVWTIPALEKITRTQPDSTVKYLDNPMIMIGVSDARGLREVKLTLDGQALAIAPGTNTGTHAVGVHAQLAKALPPAGQSSFALALELAGTDALRFLPTGNENTLTLSSNWPHPSFDGELLPVTHKIDENGFSAQWKVLALASQARQVWAASFEAADKRRNSSDWPQAVGTRLMDVVDIYTLTDRATKYGFLFVVLVLSAFALYEVFAQLKLHPVQCTLVGAALVVFYLLLLSLSERIGFDWAYLVAAASCIGLVGYYCAFLFGSIKHASAATAALASVYGALYLLINAQDNALLAGSVMLFALLAAFMVSTRKVNWHAQFGGTSGGITGPHAQAATTP
jgi:inner membrane protein